MGSSLSLLWGSTNNNSTDPVTGLTSRQKKLIQNTWGIVRKDLNLAGVTIMIA